MLLLLSHQSDLQQTHTHTPKVTAQLGHQVGEFPSFKNANVIIIMINCVHIITDCVNSAKKRENTPEAAMETLLVAVKR